MRLPLAREPFTVDGLWPSQFDTTSSPGCESTERRDHRRGSVSCGSGWSLPCVSIQLTLSQHSQLWTEGFFHGAKQAEPGGT